MNNGIGPYWFPEIIRRNLTLFGSSFFREASWNKHDEGYEAGYPERITCDRKFLQAMIRDTSRFNNPYRIAFSIFLAFTFYFAVRLFGMFSYNKK